MTTGCASRGDPHRWLPPHPAPLQMVPIPKGPCLIGTETGEADEGPTHAITLPAFAIGRYPVTNQAYACFLLAHPGYPVPRYWADRRFHQPLQPVVGVTWTDAMTYTTWLTRVLQEQGQLPTGQVVRLPLETEWEKAASWDAPTQQQRRYPWGERWDPQRVHVGAFASGGHPTPVNHYPAGQSAYGVVDMLGNVWEWTASPYASYPGLRLPFHQPHTYVLRGGSWVLAPRQLRCTYRCALPPHAWRYHLGFRIVIAPALPSVRPPADNVYERH